MEPNQTGENELETTGEAGLTGGNAPDHATYWELGPEFFDVSISIAPPERPLELLEKLGPSPFERGAFPLVGFLASTYDKVSRDALARRGGLSG